MVHSLFFWRHITYSSVINACAQKQDGAGAAKWPGALESKGLVPTVVTYSSVIKA